MTQQPLFVPTCPACASTKFQADKKRAGRVICSKCRNTFSEGELIMKPNQEIERGNDANPNQSGDVTGSISDSHPTV